MAITLEGITLPNDLRIAELYEWTGVESSVEYSVGGYPMVSERIIYGRPLTLDGGGENGVWLDHSTLQSLLALAAVPNAEYTLIVDSTSYTVRFRGEEYPPIEATPVLEYGANDGYGSTDRFCNIIIKLMEV